jgi:tetratricopeptide (TPR) repeat protein
MESPATTSPLIGAFRRHERQLAMAWLAFTALLVVVMLIAPLRVRVLDRLQGVADLWDARWDRRLADGERLVAEHRYAEAVPYLVKLDAEFPAPHTRYGRDKQREYLLRLLAQSYEALGKSGRTMETWTRLVRFDSMHYRNHFGYAQAAERLLSGWALAPEARDGYARALQLLPSHPASLRGYLDYYMDRGEFPPVTAAYKTFLDSFLLDEVTLTAGDSSVSFPVLVDGRPHDIDVALTIPAGWSGPLTVSSGAYPMAIERVAVVPALAVGRATARVARDIDLALVDTTRVKRSGAGWVPRDSVAVLRLPVQADSAGIARVELRMRVFKLMDAGFTKLVRKAYRDQLDSAGLADAMSRTAPYASAAATDSAFARIGWTKGGLYVRGER